MTAVITGNPSLICSYAYRTKYINLQTQKCSNPVLKKGGWSNATGPGVFAAADISDAARRKRGRRRNDDDLPLTSFAGLISHLATMTLNLVASPQAPNATIVLAAKPTPLQNKALALLGIPMPRVQ